MEDERDLLSVIYFNNQLSHFLIFFSSYTILRLLRKETVMPVRTGHGWPMAALRSLLTSRAQAPTTLRGREAWVARPWHNFRTYDSCCASALNDRKCVLRSFVHCGPLRPWPLSFDISQHKVHDVHPQPILTCVVPSRAELPSCNAYLHIDSPDLSRICLSEDI